MRAVRRPWSFARRSAMAAIVAVGLLLAHPVAASAAVVLADDDTQNDAWKGINGLIGEGCIRGLNWVLAYINGSTTPQLNAKGSWFVVEFHTMLVVGVWVMIPLLLISIMHAVAKGSMQLLLRCVLVYLPISVLGSVVAVEIVQLLIGMVDDFCLVFQESIKGDSTKFFNALKSGITGDDTVGEAANKGVPIFLSILLALGLCLASFMLLIVLMLRQASIYMATAFLPIGFACLVWPSASRMLRRLAEFLLAMIVSKLIIVAGLALAIASMTGAANLGTTAEQALAVNGQNTQNVAAVNGGGDGGQKWYTWLAQMMTTMVMFFLVAFSPSMAMRLMGNMGLSEMAQHVNSGLTHQGVQRQIIFGDRLMTMFQTARGIGQQRQGLANSRAAAAQTSPAEQRLFGMGITPRGDVAAGQSPYSVTRADIDAAQAAWNRRGGGDAWALTDADRDRIIRWSQSGDPNQVAQANLAFQLAQENNFGGFDDSARAANPMASVLRTRDDTHVVIPDIVDRRTGNFVTWHDPTLMERTIRRQVAAGAQNVTVFLPVREDQRGNQQWSTQEQNAVSGLTNLVRAEDQRLAARHGNAPQRPRVRIANTATASGIGRLTQAQAGVDLPNQ